MIAELSDSDSDIELFEMSVEKSEKTLLVNNTVKEKVAYTSEDETANVGHGEPGHRKAIAQRPKFSCFLLTLSFFAAIGGFLFGYDTGVVSGAMLLLKTNFDLSSFTEEVIVSVTIGTAAVFALVSGILNEYYGRKLTTIIGSLVFTVGAVVLAVSQNAAMLIAGRAIVGIGIGIASMTVPTYIAECAPSELRGRLVTINNLFITCGQFIASVLDGAFSYDKKNGWRYMLGLAAVPSVIQFIGFMFLPESPRWLISKGKVEEARKILSHIRGMADVEEELQDVKQNFEEERMLTQHRGDEHIIIKILKTPSVRRAVILGSFLQMFQQLSGINTVMYYSATIIQMTGIRDQSTAIWLAAVTAFVNFIFTLVGVWLVDRIGRRKLILSSLGGVLISLVVLAVGFQITAINSPLITTYENSSNFSDCFKYSSCESCTEDMKCGFCYIEQSTYTAVNGSCLPFTDGSRSAVGRCNSTSLPDKLVWANNYCPSPYSIMGLVGLILYLMAFAPGMGPMPWTINSEIYPLWARSTCTAIATSFNWIFNLLVSLTFLTLTEQITKYGTYWLFVGIVIIGFILIYITLPETKGLTSMTVPVYIAECAPPEMRGRLVALNNASITGGQFIASVLDGAFSYDTKNGWRYMLGIAGIPSAIQFVGFIFLPESPRWLLSKGKDERARDILRRIRDTSDVDEEIMDVKARFKEEEELNSNNDFVIKRIFTTPSVRRALILGCGLQLFQQLSGINTVMYYSASIIKMTGVRDNSTAIWMAAATAFVNFSFTFVGVWLVERIGRRLLTLLSLGGILVSLAVLAVGFQLSASNSPPVTIREQIAENSSCFAINSCQACIEADNCGFCYIENGKSAVNGSCLPYAEPSSSSIGRCNTTDVLRSDLVWADNFCPSTYSWMGLFGLIVYLMAFAPGLGPVPWTVNSEIYPLWARSACTAMATSTNWIFNLIVSLTFLTLIETITAYGTYWLFVGIVAIALIFVFITLPETKGLKLEEVQQLFEKGSCLCGKTLTDNIKDEEYQVSNSDSSVPSTKL